ncbi:MAG: glycosyltransferase family 39 protein, partial [Candidatus Sulfotelmatobacter sp.]
MPSSHQQTISHAISAESWPQGRIDLAAGFILLFSLLARVWAASGTFLNPDEALHFRLANQTSWALAYRQSLTASHPPLLTFILYFWRGLGTSELWLRMPSILAGVVFCWMFYKWLRNAAGDLAGLIGLIFVSFLPPVVLLSAEIRQYALLLAFLASALYFLDDSFALNSSARMIAFSLCLYLAMLSHYSAFWFAAALGIYALLRFFTGRFSTTLKMTWAIGQIGALALAIFLYKSHISKLGVGESRTALQ